MMVVGPNFQDAHFSMPQDPMCAKKIKKGGHQKLGVGRLFAINNIDTPQNRTLLFINLVYKIKGNVILLYLVYLAMG